jgi:hypothetical protein
MLSQFVTAIDAGAVCPSNFDELGHMLRETVRTTHGTLVAWEKRPFKIVVCGRDGAGIPGQFRAATLSWDVNDEYLWSDLRLPSRSDLILTEGSGSAAVAASVARTAGTPAEGTSRAVFSAFSASVNRGDDPNSGGSPQLVGLYRVGAGRTFGVVNRGRRYLHGLPIDGAGVDPGLEWRNDLFERCDGTTGCRLPGAQRH